MNRSRIEVAVFVCGLALLWGVVGEARAQLSSGVRAPAAKLYRFPGADTNDDSQPSVVWYVSGDHRPESKDPAGPGNMPSPGRDLGVMRFDAGSKKWTRSRFGSPSGTNEADLIFGMKLYAPADGEVVTCWRNAPENPNPGGVLPERDGCGDDDKDGNVCDDFKTCSCTIPRSGNHLNIRTADGSVMLIAHLKSGSIPAELCPKTATYVKDANAAPVHDGAYYDDIYIKAGSRPKVYRGQYLGRAGNSGASSGPHTHVHLKPCDSCDSVPFQFENARRQEVSMDPQANADPAKWISLNAALLPKQDPGQKREIVKPDLAPPQK